MNVIIVGRTKMSGTSRCIGGITPNGTSVRLLNQASNHFDVTAPFQIGQIWDMAYTAVATPVPPHVEDVLVTQYNLVDTISNLQAYVLSCIKPWKGDITQIFEGKLGFTGQNNGYVCRNLGVPRRSTWFWIPDRDLILRADGKHYDYFNGLLSGGLTYVGEAQAVPRIPAGTLVRVSLARWWRPHNADPSLEERCYLQLSGWF